LKHIQKKLLSIEFLLLNCFFDIFIFGPCQFLEIFRWRAFQLSGTIVAGIVEHVVIDVILRHYIEHVVIDVMLRHLQARGSISSYIYIYIYIYI
jgi:hypothetical protein